MQHKTTELLKVITEAIQDKKGQNIVIVDFQNIPSDVICKYFVICEGRTHIQVDAIAGEVSDQTRIKLGEKAIGANGLENCLWACIDYGDIIVHIFQPEARRFYDLEHLWADAKITEIPNLD